jgi:hypothetical protein
VLELPIQRQDAFDISYTIKLIAPRRADSAKHILDEHPRPFFAASVAPDFHARNTRLSFKECSQRRIHIRRGVPIHDSDDAAAFTFWKINAHNSFFNKDFSDRKDNPHKPHASHEGIEHEFSHPHF